MIQKEKLFLLRKEKRLTQMQVAEEIKVSRQAVSGWETGTVVPSIENLKSLSILYGVPVDYLLNEENERISDGIPTLLMTNISMMIAPSMTITISIIQ